MGNRLLPKRQAEPPAGRASRKPWRIGADGMDHAVESLSFRRQVLRPQQVTLFATGLFYRFGPAELTQRRIPSLLWRHSRLNVFPRLHFDVGAHLLIHLNVEFLLLNPSSE